MTVSSREIIVVCGYMFYGIRISNKLFLYFPTFASASFKDGSRQYKCHNISNSTSLLSSNVDVFGELGG